MIYSYICLYALDPLEHRRGHHLSSSVQLHHDDDDNVGHQLPPRCGVASESIHQSKVLPKPHTGKEKPHPSTATEGSTPCVTKCRRLGGL